jgi:hypothetical protein
MTGVNFIIFGLAALIFILQNKKNILLGFIVKLLAFSEKTE